MKNEQIMLSEARPQNKKKASVYWKAYCEGQEVGFKKAEDVFERMKLVQETVDCIRYTFNEDTESHKLVRNCMALVQNAIDGEYHDMEDIDVSKSKSDNTLTIEITDEQIVKLIDRYFEIKGIEIKEIGII